VLQVTKNETIQLILKEERWNELKTGDQFRAPRTVEEQAPMLREVMAPSD
jgi:hypothetical protein